MKPIRRTRPHEPWPTASCILLALALASLVLIAIFFPEGR